MAQTAKTSIVFPDDAELNDEDPESVEGTYRKIGLFKVDVESAEYDPQSRTLTFISKFGGMGAQVVDDWESAVEAFSMAIAEEEWKNAGNEIEVETELV